MKLKKFFFIILLFLSCIYSCKKDFLEVPDKTVLLQEAYVVDLKTTNEFLNGIYVELGAFFYRAHNYIYPELVADNLKPTATNSLGLHYSWTQQASDATQTSLIRFSQNSNAYWLYGYKLARACSFLVNNTDEYRNENPAQADDIKGQAYAIRALLHFVIVNVFAQPYSFTNGGTHPGIPYITTNDFARAVSRKPLNEVYEQMIADLENAIKLLPENPGSKLYMNKNSAMALLARIYLFKGDYLAAKNIAVEVGNKVPIMTGANYPSKLFTPDETEALFQLPPSAKGVPGRAGDYATLFAGFYLNSTRPEFVPTSDITSLLQENLADVRSAWVASSGTTWTVKKYPSNVLPGTLAPAGAYYQTLFRSSEMYLTASEAFVNLNNEDSAKFYLDAIRKRADPNLSNSTAIGQALVDSIYKERRKELCFEGLRMFDLLRWKSPVNRADAPNPLAQLLPYPSDRAIAPIPLQDVQLSGLAQNPSY